VFGAGTLSSSDRLGVSSGAAVMLAADHRSMEIQRPLEAAARSDCCRPSQFPSHSCPAWHSRRST
jgi:hypothetical protein